MSYRFALFGRRNSGKTCLLAAMGLARQNRDGSATIKRLDVAPSIAEAAARLERGDVPEATPVEDRLECRYEFSDSHRGRALVEMFDYSGEMLEQLNSQNSQEFAERLRRVDGLIILADVPGGDAAEMPAELERLSRSFSQLNSTLEQARLDTPIALVLSKWDRQGLGTDEDSLQEWLDANPAYNSLQKSVRNACGDDNFRLFPVSVLGPCEVNEQGREVPRQVNPLASFGLEDPFQFLIARRDELDSQAAEKAAAKGGFLRTLSAWGKRQREERQDAKALVARLPDDSPHRESAGKAKDKLSRRSWWCGLSCVLIALVGWLTLEGIWDASSYRGHVAVLDDAESPDERIRESEAWLQDYSRSTWRHIGFSFWRSKDETRELIERKRESRARYLWGMIKEATEATKRKLAEDYIDRFPNGEAREEAQQVIADFETRLKRTKNVEWVTGLENAANPILDRLRESKNPLPADLEKLRSVVRSLREDIPHRDVEFPNSARHALLSRIEADVGDAMRRLDVAGLVSQVNRHLDSELFLAAGEALNGRVGRKAPTDSDVAALIAAFAKRAPEQFKARHAELLKDGHWSKAADLVRSTRDRHDAWNPALQWEGAGVLFENLAKETNARHDRTLYERFREQKTRASAQSYLDSAPIGSMRIEVKKWLDWYEP